MPGRALTPASGFMVSSGAQVGLLRVPSFAMHLPLPNCSVFAGPFTLLPLHGIVSTSHCVATSRSFVGLEGGLSVNADQ